MKDFQLRNDTKLLFRSEPEKELQEFTAGKKVLFIYGSGSAKRNGCYDDVKNAVAKSGGTLYEAGNSRSSDLKMLQFEIKKVFFKFKNKIAILLLLIILIVTSILTMNRVEYVDMDGNRYSGFAAAKNLRAEQNKWAGYLTEDVFADVVKENRQINNSSEALSDDIVEQDKAYSRKQAISDICTLINCAFSEWRDYNYYAIDNISAMEAKQVYEKRISSLKKYLDSGEETFTEAQKKFLIHQYENLKTPFYYEYIGGWIVILRDKSNNLSLFPARYSAYLPFLSSLFSLRKPDNNSLNPDRTYSPSLRNFCIFYIPHGNYIFSLAVFRRQNIPNELPNRPSLHYTAHLLPDFHILYKPDILQFPSASQNPAWCISLSDAPFP